MKKRSEGLLKSNKKYFFIALRYLILLAIVFTLPLIYRIFTPLTVYPVVFLLKLFFNEVTFSQNLVNGEIISILIINLKTFIQIIPACIAGSAYLLLVILNLTVQMDIKKRIYSLLISIFTLLALNIVRIILFAIIYYNNSPLFDFAHQFFWYVLSTIFVVLIWFFTVKTFSIKEIPVYSDVKYLMRDIKKK